MSEDRQLFLGITVGLLLVIGHCESLWAHEAQMSSAVTDYSQAIAQVRKDLKRKLRKEKVAGASIAIVDGQKLVWSEGVGFADYSIKKPATATTLYQAGDITKLITAIAVMRLVESGKVDLETPLPRLFPALHITTFQPELPPPTLRNLLSHHSGMAYNTLAGSYLAEPPSHALVAKSAYIAQPPGQAYTYSQTAYNLLGQLVSEHSSETYVKTVTDTILKPMGMHSAGFDTSNALARGHKKRKPSDVPTFSRDVAAMGLIANVNDLARLMQWFLASETDPILARKWVDEMARVQNAGLPLDLHNDAGLAWQLTNTGRHRIDRVLRLNASTNDFHGLMLLAPEEQIGIVLMSNSSNATDFVLEIGRRALDLALEAKLGVVPADADWEMPAMIPLAREASDDVMQAHYSSPLGVLKFSGKPERLDMDFLGRTFRAKRRSDGWYTISYRLLGLFDLRFSFLTDLLLRPTRVAGQRVLQGYYQGAQFLAGSVLEQLESPHPKLGHLVGDYQLLNPDSLSKRLELNELELGFDQGRLFVSYRLPAFITLRPKLALQARGGNEFAIAGLGSNVGDRIQFSPDGRRFIYSGYTFERSD